MLANTANNFGIGITAIVTDEKILMNKEFKFVLLVRLRNSSIIFSYPVLMNSGDGNL